MTKNEKLGIVPNVNPRWLVSSISKRFSLKMRHKVKFGTIIFPNHGSNEVGTGLEKKLLKQAGLRK